MELVAEQTLRFDYDQLDGETRLVVQQRTGEIRALMRRTAQDIIEIGQKLIEVKERLGHGHFLAWLEAEFQWTDRTAQNFMNVARRFKSENVSDLTIASSALYLLAAPSTPEEARWEALDRAEQGEAITHTKAKEIVDHHKPEARVVRASPDTPSQPSEQVLLLRARIEEAIEGTPVEQQPGAVGLLTSCYKWHGPDLLDAVLELIRSGEFETVEAAFSVAKQMRDADAPPNGDMAHVPRGAGRGAHVRRDAVPSAIAPRAPLAPLMTSDSCEWYTPPEVIERVVRVMGEIDLDPCSNSGEQPNVPARHHLTVEEDGLSHPWFGRVYMNPPYGRVIDQWVEKLVREYKYSNVDVAIALVPARTDTKWFRRLRDYPVCFVHGRLRFSDADNSATFPSAIIGLGVPLAEFVDAFDDIGDVYQRVKRG